MSGLKEFSLETARPIRHWLFYYFSFNIGVMWIGVSDEGWMDGWLGHWDEVDIILAGNFPIPTLGGMGGNRI